MINFAKNTGKNMLSLKSMRQVCTIMTANTYVVFDEYQAQSKFWASVNSFNPCAVVCCNSTTNWVAGPTAIYFLTILQDQSQKSKCQQGLLPLKPIGQGPSCSLLASGGPRRPLTCDSITIIFTWLSLCVSVSKFSPL